MSVERDPLERLLAGLGGDDAGDDSADAWTEDDPWAGRVEAAALTDEQEAWLARFDDQPPLPRIRGDLLGE